MLKDLNLNRLFILIISLLILIIYSNSFNNSFQFDDYHVIEKNPYIKNIKNILKFFLHPDMGSGIVKETSGYRPLLMISFTLNYALGNLNVFGYHLLNVSIHIICSILVYFIILYLLENYSNKKISEKSRIQLISVFAAIIFAVHPIQTESVTYISGRSSSLTALFFLISFLTFIKFQISKNFPVLLISVFAYLCALLVKETAITLLIILFCFILFFYKESNLKTRSLSLLPHFTLTLIYLSMRFIFFGTLKYSSEPIRPMFENILTQIKAWVYMMGTLVLPLNLNIDYDFPIAKSFFQLDVLWSSFILVNIFILIWRISKTEKLIGFFALWFAINLAPTSSFIPLEDIIADRWLYLSSISFAFYLSLGSYWLFEKFINGKKSYYYILFFFSCFLIIELYSFSSLMRNFDWRSDWTLWEDTVMKSPNKARPHIGYGLALMYAGKFPEATKEFKYAMKLDPKDGRAYLNLGLIYYWQNDYEEAVKLYQKAIYLSPKLSSEGFNNIGLAYLKLGLKEKALNEFQKAIDSRPINPNPYYNLGVYFGDNGDVSKAILYLEKAISLDPEFYWAHLTLSRLYEKKGWKEKSFDAYQNYLKKAFFGRNYLPGK